MNIRCWFGYHDFDIICPVAGWSDERDKFSLEYLWHCKRCGRDVWIPFYAGRQKIRWPKNDKGTPIDGMF